MLAQLQDKLQGLAMDKNSNSLIKAAVGGRLPGLAGAALRGTANVGKGIVGTIGATGSNLNKGVLEGLAHGALYGAKTTGKLGWQGLKRVGPDVLDLGKWTAKTAPALARGAYNYVPFALPLAAGGAYYGYNKLKGRPKTWAERVSEKSDRASHPLLNKRQRGNETGKLIRDEFLNPVFGSMGAATRDGPLNAAMMGGLITGLPAAILGGIRTKSLSGAGQYGAIGAAGGAGMAAGLSALSNMRDNEKWNRMEGIRTPGSYFGDGFSNAPGQRWKSGSIKEASSYQTSAITRIYSDPTLSLPQRSILSNMIQQLSPADRLALDRVVSGTFGAGVGFVISKFLLNRGKKTVVLGTILGGLMGASRGKPQRSPGMSMGGERYVI